MASTNRFGLSRYIPASVRKQVRRRCKFGCVVCGSAVVTYEHMEPPYSDAKSHDPNQITLLCGHHPLESSKGLLSKERIEECNKRPKGAERGFVDAVFDLGGAIPSVFLATNALALGPGQVFSINDLPVLKIGFPERKSRKWLLSAIFYEKSRRPVCHIEKKAIIYLTKVRAIPTYRSSSYRTFPCAT